MTYLDSTMEDIIVEALRFYATSDISPANATQSQLADDFADALENDTWLMETATPPETPPEAMDEDKALAIINNALPRPWNVQKQANGQYAAFYGDGARRDRFHSPDTAAAWILEHLS